LKLIKLKKDKKPPKIAVTGFTLNRQENKSVKKQRGTRYFLKQSKNKIKEDTRIRIKPELFKGCFRF